jgi:uncharacterized repeat protein (TIGR03803 family)
MANSTQRHPWVCGMRTASDAFVLAIALTLGIAGAQSAYGQSYREKTLYSFKDGTDGASPVAGLIMDAAGNLYGTTSSGGGNRCRGYGCGTVFQLDSTGKERVLYRFRGGNDGAVPSASLLRDGSGNLYGTTVARSPEEGGGTVFKLSKAGKETVLHRFGNGPDGYDVAGGLVSDTSGNFYGTTTLGGSDRSLCGGTGCGIVYKVSQAGKETILYNFTGSSDGQNPYAGLTRDAAGNLYGTTASGGGVGQCRGNAGCGTVFKIDTTGKETVLYRFSGGTDGGYPLAPLVRDATGNLYGTAEVGGDLSGCGGSGCGTVFKLDGSATLTVLHTFTGQWPDGGQPQSGVIMDGSGNLYGTTVEGGAWGFGTVYELHTSGTLTLLHSFIERDGAFPYAPVMMDSEGNLYGTAPSRGAYDYGTVFKLTAQ